MKFAKAAAIAPLLFFTPGSVFARPDEEKSPYMLRSRSRKTQDINNGKNKGDKSRVFVKYVSGGKGAVANALGAAGGEIHYGFDALDVIAVSVPTAALDGLSRNPNIVLVEEDPVRSLTPIILSTSAVPFHQRRASAGQTVPYGVDMVQARDVWDVDRDGSVNAGAYTGSNRTVCIIDSGFLESHEDLQDVSVTGYNGNLRWNEDGDGHGTHVAGTIAAVNNHLGVVGVTPGTVNLYIVRVFGNDGNWGYSSNLIDAANRCATAGVNIISMSLGGGFSSTTERTAFDNLNTQGILSIAAAGNTGTRSNQYPASYSSVISVAAIDSSKVKATFSTSSAEVDLAAPGVGVISTTSNGFVGSLTVNSTSYTGTLIEGAIAQPASGMLMNGLLCDSVGSWSGKVVLCQRGGNTFADKVLKVENGGGVAALIYNNVPGLFAGTLGGTSSIPAIGLSDQDGIYLVANELDANSVVGFQDGYAFLDGTSMATPHVSAVAALVWSARPTATNAAVRASLIATAEDLGVSGRDDSYGYGLVQAKKAIDYLLTLIDMRVAELSATKSYSGGKWSATITIKVFDANNVAISGVSVTGAWSGAKTGAATCTTAVSGTCNVVASNMSNVAVTFTTTNLVKTGYVYNGERKAISVTK